MKHKHLLSLMLIILITIPMTGWGQALFENHDIQFEPSRLFPILSDTDIVGAPDDAIPTVTIKKLDDRCRSRVPARFTPSAHDDYCTCAAAATQGTMTIGNLRTLQKEANRKLGNATFEKYVENVMKPCMEIPAEDIEYLSCISSAQNDWRIKLPIPYCRCVSRGMKDHFVKNGLEEMMLSWPYPNNVGEQSPVDTLWDSSQYIKEREIQKSECAGHYMDSKYFK